jgi:hypothetical protein
MGIDCAVAFSRVDGLLRQLAQDLHVADLRAVLSEVFGFMRYEGERTIDYFSPAGPCAVAPVSCGQARS